MKKKRSFRLSSELDEKLITFAEKLNITPSQLIELACSKLLDDNNIEPTNIITEQSTRENRVKVNLSLDNLVFKKLLNEINKKNSTFSQEILYRLSASLDNPVFDSQEFNKLWALRTDLNRLGNLIKLAINNKIPFDDDLLNETNSNLDELKNEISNILTEVRRRTFKGVLK